MNLSERLQNDPSFQPCGHLLLRDGLAANCDDAIAFLIARRKLTIDANSRAAIWIRLAPGYCDPSCREAIQ